MNWRSAGIVLMALAAVLGAHAQSGPVRVALLGSGSATSSAIFVDGLRDGLRDQGLVEGRDYLLDVRWAERDYRRFSALAQEIVEHQPKVILASTVAATRALQRATRNIPIV